MEIIFANTMSGEWNVSGWKSQYSVECVCVMLYEHMNTGIKLHRETAFRQGEIRSIDVCSYILNVTILHSNVIIFKKQYPFPSTPSMPELCESRSRLKIRHVVRM